MAVWSIFNERTSLDDVHRMRCTGTERFKLQQENCDARTRARRRRRAWRPRRTWSRRARWSRRTRWSLRRIRWSWRTRWSRSWWSRRTLPYGRPARRLHRRHRMGSSRLGTAVVLVALTWWRGRWRSSGIRVSTIQPLWRELHRMDPHARRPGDRNPGSVDELTAAAKQTFASEPVLL